MFIFIVEHKLSFQCCSCQQQAEVAELALSCSGVSPELRVSWLTTLHPSISLVKAQPSEGEAKIAIQDREVWSPSQILQKCLC